MQTREVYFGFGQVWFGAIPEHWHFTPTATKETTLFREPRTSLTACCIGLKIQMLQDVGRSGVLGLHYEPDESHNLLIRVGVREAMDPHGLGGTGLREHFAEAVLDETTKALQENDVLGSGVLEFSYARWDALESSEHVYRWLALCLIQLLNPAMAQASADEIATLIRQARAQIYTTP